MHELYSARMVFCGTTCSIFLAVCVCSLLMFIIHTYWTLWFPVGQNELMCSLKTKNVVMREGASWKADWLRKFFFLHVAWLVTTWAENAHVWILQSGSNRTMPRWRGRFVSVHSSHTLNIILPVSLWVFVCWGGGNTFRYCMVEVGTTCVVLHAINK